MTERYPTVTVTSLRPSATGHRVQGQTGEGVILPDEPRAVYVTAQRWYGSWPLEETDVAELRAAQQLAEEMKRAAEEARYSHATRTDFATALAVLHQTLKENNQNIEASESPYLLSRDGKYLRPPTIEEFSKTFTQLDEEGKVSP